MLKPGSIYKLSAVGLDVAGHYMRRTKAEAMRFVALDEKRLRYANASADTLGCVAEPGDYVLVEEVNHAEAGGVK